MAQELWQIAKPYGRPRLFETPEALWDAFIAYVEWSTNNPLTISDTRSQKKSDIKAEKSQRKQQTERPLTLSAFRLHASIKREWATFKKDYESKGEEYCQVLQAIEGTVRNQQVQNALVGNYKENLVARLNGISDSIKQEVSADVKTKASMSVTEAKAFLEELENKI